MPRRRQRRRHRSQQIPRPAVRVLDTTRSPAPPPTARRDSRLGRPAAEDAFAEELVDQGPKEASAATIAIAGRDVLVFWELA